MTTATRKTAEKIAERFRPKFVRMYTDSRELADAIDKALSDERERHQWQPIETAPKKVEWEGDGHGYGPYILAWPVFYEVARVRWWQSKSGGQNFLEDGGNAAHPTRWMPLPDPPANGSEGD